MSTQVITPQPGEAVITTDYGHHHGHHGYHGDFEARADYRSLINQGERNGDRTTNGVQVTGDRITAVGSAMQSGFTSMHDRLCDATGKLTHEIDRHGDASALAACKTDDAIADSKLFSAVQFKDQIIEANKNASNLSSLVQTVGNAAQVLASTIGNAASVQATANYNGLTVQVERVRAELESKIESGNAAAVLLATQLDAQARREAAECCCELKALITAEGVASRALANEIEARRTQTELVRLQTQVAILTGGVVGARAA